nr:hypothetical protein [uncultured Rhodopila sp.]
MTTRFFRSATPPAIRGGMAAGCASSPLPGRLTVTALLLIGGWLHGIAAGLAWSLRDSADSDLAQAFGVSPMELMIAGIAAIGLYRGGATERLGLPALGFVLLLLVPSSLAAHGSLVLFALWVAAGTGGQMRSSALLFAGLGAYGLWGVLDEQIAGDWPLRADAILTQNLLHAVLPGIERVGNVLGVPGGHRIVILAGCSTAYGLPLVLLALAALSLRDGRLPPRFGRAALGLAVLYTAANLLRLCFLAVSAEFYRIGHGPYGEMVFDALVIAMPLVIAGRLTHGMTIPDPVTVRAVPAGRLWASALLGLLLIGLGIKAARIAEQPMQPREKQAQVAVLAFLADRGWQPARRQGLTLDGANMIQYFSRSGCPGALAVALAPRAPEAASMLRLALGGDMRWLEAGVLYQDPPIGRQAWRVTLAAAIARLGGPRDRVMPILAIAPAPGGQGACAPPGADAWTALAALP